jgi:hypothetical protein
MHLIGKYAGKRPLEHLCADRRQHWKQAGRVETTFIGLRTGTNGWRLWMWGWLFWSLERQRIYWPVVQLLWGCCCMESSVCWSETVISAFRVNKIELLVWSFWFYVPLPLWKLPVISVIPSLNHPSWHLLFYFILMQF